MDWLDGERGGERKRLACRWMDFFFLRDLGDGIDDDGLVRWREGGGVQDGYLVYDEIR